MWPIFKVDEMRGEALHFKTLYFTDMLLVVKTGSECCWNMEVLMCFGFFFFLSSFEHAKWVINE